MPSSRIEIVDWVTSEMGVGSDFQMTLPLPGTGDPPPALVQGDNEIRCWICEPDEGPRQALLRLLSALGIKAADVDSAHEAFDRAESVAEGEHVLLLSLAKVPVDGDPECALLKARAEALRRRGGSGVRLVRRLGQIEATHCDRRR